MIYDRDNQVHPSAILSGPIHLGSRNIIGPHCVLEGPLSIGDDNHFFAGCVIGTSPEDRNWQQPSNAHPQGDQNLTIIGSRNIFREYCVVNRGTKSSTRIGSQNFFQRGVHVGHDAVVGSNANLACNSLIAGHVEVHSWVTLGMGVAVHQNAKLEFGLMAGMNSALRGSIGAFLTLNGNPASVIGLNKRKLEHFNVPKSIWPTLARRELDLSELAQSSSDLALEVQQDRDYFDQGKR